MPNSTIKIPEFKPEQYFYITLVIIIFILLILFSWIANRLSLKDRSCNKLKIYWPTLTNTTYFLTIVVAAMDTKITLLLFVL